MSADHQSATIEWKRVSGAFANASGPHGPCDPTIGIGHRKCECCEAEYVLIAAIDAHGREVNVALPLEQACAVGEEIHRIIADYIARNPREAN